jgi:hypothetical protein
MRGRRGIRKPANLGVQRATITRQPLQHACTLAKPFNETLLRTPYPAWRYDLPNLSTQRQMHSVEVSCYPTFDSSNSKNVITTTAVLLSPGSRVARSEVWPRNKTQHTEENTPDLIAGFLAYPSSQETHRNEP